MTAGCRAKGRVDELSEQEPESPEEKSGTGKTEETGMLGGDLGWVEFVLLTAILKGLLGSVLHGGITRCLESTAPVPLGLLFS